MLEPAKRIELSTPSLPRKYSTPELHRLLRRNVQLKLLAPFLERKTRFELATYSLEGYRSTN
jgi:hypothetical protein